jgi:formate-dependent nitrite reductase membrane component NrfD
MGDKAAMIAGLLGLGLSGYTGVLVAHTTVAIWQRPHRFLPVLFLASGVTSAASLFDIMGVDAREEPAVSIFGTAGKFAEIVCAHFLQKSVATVAEAARPLEEGFSGFLWKAAKILTVTSLALALISRRNPSVRRISGVLGTLGSLCTRFAIHYAGQQSAMNPRATFHQQRKGQGAIEIEGRAAISGPAGERAV